MRAGKESRREERLFDFLKDVSREEGGQESHVEGGGGQVGGREGEGGRGAGSDWDLQGPKYLEPGTGGPARTARRGMWGLSWSRLGGRGLAGEGRGRSGVRRWCGDGILDWKASVTSV